jgi:3-hydroxyisobutyrate dehydrogenase-like beta-hydroxyacid dehydrogenase
VNVAFLGLGIMGSRMAANLRDAGHDLVVWNRTRAKAEPLGVPIADTPADAARDAEVVISMVVDGPQVEEVLLADATGAAHGAKPGTLFADMSTISPRTARAVAERLAEKDLRFLDAPVTGSSPAAEAGTLTIMAGGSHEEFLRAEPLFEVMGQLVLHVGETGQGQMLKLVNNAVAAANAVALAQALTVAKGTGVDLEALTKVMAAGSGGSKMLDLKAAPMIAHDYSTLFKTAHMLKDVRHCLEEAQDAGVPFPAAAFAREVLSGAVGRGHADEDFASVMEVIEGLSGVRI